MEKDVARRENEVAIGRNVLIEEKCDKSNSPSACRAFNRVGIVKESTPKPS